MPNLDAGSGVHVSSENLRAGIKLYRDGCSGCHGDAGKPSSWGTQDFYPGVPQFDTEPPAKPDWQLFWIIKHGIRHSGMAAWQGLMNDSDACKVDGFLSHLKNLPPDIESDWRGKM